MSQSDQALHDYLMQDLLHDLPGITSKRMFGGYGIYQDGIIFAMIGFGKIMFKVGDSNRQAYEDKGMKQFVYTHPKSGKITPMPYYELPPDILEDPDQLPTWIAASVQATKASKKN